MYKSNEREKLEWFQGYGHDFEEAIKMYFDGADVALSLWSDPEEREERGVSCEEVATELVRDSALLRRYSGEEDMLTVLMQWPKADRRTLTIHAARQLAKRWIRCAAVGIFDNDLGHTEMMQLKDLLLERDAMEETLRALQAIAKDFLAENDEEVSDLIGRAQVAISEADEVLKSHKVPVGRAAGIFQDLLENSVITPEKDRFWWFYEARGWCSK